MPSIVVERIERLLPGRQIHPFDFVNNPIFYIPRPQPGEQMRRLMATVKIANIAANLTSRGIRSIFAPGSMSNGYEATKLAEDYAEKIRAFTKAQYGEEFLTTQRLKHVVAHDELMHRVILPMRLQNHQLADEAERLFPDCAVVGPVDFEGPIRMLRGDNALMHGAAFQDWTFEHWWVPRVIVSEGMVLGGDHAYSRYANVEEITADLIQCGLLDQYRDTPGRDYPVVDTDYRPVPLADRAWETAKHIVDVVERGFRSDLAVAALVVRFQIDDWLRDRNGPLDREALHPVLQTRRPAEIARMDRLKKLMLPYLAQKCVAGMPYDEDRDLKAYFEKNILPITKGLTPKKIEQIRKELFAYQPRGGFNHPVYGAGKPEEKPGPDLTRAFLASARTAKRRGTDGVYFEDRSVLFGNQYFKNLQVWEQAATRFLIGCMETHRLPENAPNAAFYACEPKGGVLASKYATVRGIVDLKQAQSAEDPTGEDSFAREVMAPNTARDRVAQDHLADELVMQQRRVQNVVTTLDFLDLRDAAEHYREFVAAPSISPRLSSEAVLALQMEWFDRNAQTLVLRQGWENHSNDIEMMWRAVQHATGLIDRPEQFEGGKFRMEIFVFNSEAKTPEERMKKQDLYSLLTTLAAAAEAKLDVLPHVPDRISYLTCARLLEVIDKARDPGARNYKIEQDRHTGAFNKTDHELVHWQSVDNDLWRFLFTDPKQAAQVAPTRPGATLSLRDRLFEKLRTVGVLEFTQDDLKGLQHAYVEAWNVAHNEDVAARQTRTPGGVRQRWNPN